ncbi:Gfo/Idh/MocA family protein [Larkinella terrae]|uniref:Gfo/Idh/MocA family oxidoreductase n=1 Tax=Larkinella terrae TaxID=2025311 RepID=A0A7K0EV12_9BACT|nr:Gfo/Idh/MocA family oxidoreductase [Larkinella terrae]MRS65278.1 gfo/Idh/MocA family oxidoreductase [Larkinella terrae]
MIKEKSDRRTFLAATIKGTAALSVGGILPGFSPRSYANIVGANERVNVGIMGVNNRGRALAKNFASQPNSRVVHISDVDSRASARSIEEVTKVQNSKPVDTPDFRKALEDKQLDALVIAAPDFWHAHASIMALKAGKHVYVEKPCSYDPNEGELLVKASKKYKGIIQMGNQRRSWPNIVKAIQELHAGAIGRVYFGKGWYANTRLDIGKGKETAVPSWLNYDLWQGPVPRRPYRDNLVHYNWHWFWHWGTGEAVGNGVHMLDMLRWGMGVDYPVRVTSAGGRYHFSDDWETPDTQIITWEFANKSSILWEARSCNGHGVDDIGVGVTFYGENGSLTINGNGYILYDLKGAVVKTVKEGDNMNLLDRSNPSQNLDSLHFQNFFDAIKTGAALNADIPNGHISTLLCQLGNIAWRTGDVLLTDPTNGHILNSAKGKKLWARTYEPGWELTV